MRNIYPKLHLLRSFQHILSSSTSEDEIVSLISSLSISTSCGPDSITAKMLKSTPHSIAYPLKLIFDMSISTGQVSSFVESVQFFALKVISKSWSSSYSTLLQHLKLDTLSIRRSRAKLISLFKLMNNNYVVFP